MGEICYSVSLVAFSASSVGVIDVLESSGVAAVVFLELACPSVFQEGSYRLCSALRVVESTWRCLGAEVGIESSLLS